MKPILIILCNGDPCLMPFFVRLCTFFQLHRLAVALDLQITQPKKMNANQADGLTHFISHMYVYNYFEGKDNCSDYTTVASM